MKKKLFNILIVIITISSLTGCALLVKNQIAENSNKNYHFTDFYYTHLSSTEEEAFDFMKKFPVKKVMFLISKEHNINIDISEFQKFLLTNKPSGIKVKKGFRKEFFSWNSDSDVNNKVMIHYKRDYFDQKRPEFKISLFINGKTYDLMDTEVRDNEHLLKRMTGYFQSAEQSIAEYERLDYDKKSPVPGIIEYSPASNTDSDEDIKVVSDKKSEIENLMKNYVKDLNKEEKAEFRHEMLDLIYKITE
jgi:hypothetical protein